MTLGILCPGQGGQNPDCGKDSGQILIHREQQAGPGADSSSEVGRQTWSVH